MEIIRTLTIDGNYKEGKCMKRVSLVLSLLLVAIVALTTGIISCAPAPEQQGGDNQGTAPEDGITIIFDFSGTFLPDDYSVIPFVVGSLGSINTNKYFDWDKVTNGGIRQDGTGSHVMTKIDSTKWKFFIRSSDILLDPNTPTTVEFKAANYSTEGWSQVVANFWNTIGNQLTGIANEKIVISNKQIIAAYKPGASDPTVRPGQTADGMILSSDGKTLTIKVAEHGGWSVHITYNVNNVSLTIISTNVSGTVGGNPATHYRYRGPFTDWGNDNPPVNATIVSNNPNGTVTIRATFNYTGPGKTEYKPVASPNGTDFTWASGGNQVIIIPRGVTHFTNIDGVNWTF